MLSQCSLGCSRTVPIVCSPLDAGQTDIVIDRHDRPIADFRDKWRPYMINFKHIYMLVIYVFYVSTILRVIT